MSRLALAWAGVTALLVVGLLPLTGDAPIPTTVGFACLLIAVIALPGLALVTLAARLSTPRRPDYTDGDKRGHHPDADRAE